MLIRGTGYDDASGMWVVPDRYDAVVDVADHHPDDRLAMIWYRDGTDRRTITWATMRSLSSQYGRWLADRGVKAGDVVALVLQQTPEAAAMMLAILRIRGVVASFSTRWSTTEIADRCERIAARMVVTEEVFCAGIAERAAGREVVGIESIDPFRFDPTPFVVAGGADDPAHLYFTSGTTGPAKALVHAQRNVVGHNEFEVCHALEPGDRFLGAGEWAWSHPKLLGPWRHGATHIVHDFSERFDARSFLDVLASEGVTSALLNPSLLRRVRAEVGDDVPDWRPRTVCSSNERLNPDVALWFERCFGVPVFEYYGLTESYPMIGHRAGQPVRSGTTGRPLPGWDVELFEGDRIIDGPGHGEARLRAHSNPQYPLGYLTPVGTLTPFPRDWFATGDEFTRDEQGDWTFEGRASQFIKSSGYRIGPDEVDSVLERHPNVDEAGTYALPDDLRGEAVHAHIVLAEGVDADEALISRLQEWVAEAYAPFAIPRTIRFVSDIPRTGTGKVQRRALLERELDLRSRT